MIAYVRGRVLTTTVETVIVDIGGIGYEIYCSKGAFEKAVVGETVELLIMTPDRNGYVEETIEVTLYRMEQ